MMIISNQAIVTAQGLYALRLAQDNSVGNFNALSAFEQGQYLAKAERVLYDLAYSEQRMGPEALGRLF